MKNETRQTLYDRQFKIKHLGYGEWIDEPDRIEFEYKGIKCLVIRICKREPCAHEEAWFGGHLCGYIFLPKEHPLYGKDIDEVDLPCHFGVTFAEKTQEGHMIGFDCAHSEDLIPSMVQLGKRFSISEIFPVPENLKDHPLFKPIYRNMSYCIKQCKRMVREALKMTETV
jgi:hypothetical protein